MHHVETEQQLRMIESYLERRRCSLYLPGLACAVLVRGEVALLCCSGHATPGHPVTPHTPFVIGSLSKSFTALAVMQLVEAGLLDLDTPVSQYLPWFTLRDRNASSRITVRHLLTHTSGISRYAGRTLLSKQHGDSLEASVRALRTMRLSSPVGSTFAYSNTNYMVAGLLIEVVSGMPYAVYIEEHIFRPLGMPHSFCSEQQADDAGLQGYRWWFGIPLPFTAPYLDDALPAAYIVSCAEDMGRYLRACLNAGNAQDAILSPVGFASLYAANVAVSGKNVWYGLGWRRQRLDGDVVLRHGGEVSNFRADMVLLPERNLGAVVLQNANNGLVAQAGLDQIALDVVRLLVGQSLPRRKLTFRHFYTLIDLLVVLLSILQMWLFVRLWRVPARRHRARGVVAGLVEAMSMLLVCWQVPCWADMPWRGLLLYVPDLSRWLLCMGSLSWFKLVVRIAKWSIK